MNGAGRRVKRICRAKIACGGTDYDAVRAQSRLNHLRLEPKGQKETPDIKPGVYEQNIGLKHGSPC